MTPGGQRNLLTVDSNGYLSSVTNPAGETTTLTYYPAPVENPELVGLLHTFTDPEGNTSTMSYDAIGLLTRDEDALGGFKDLVKEDFLRGYKVTMTTAEGRTTSYEMQTLNTGEVSSIMTDRFGGQTITQANGDGSTTTTYPDGTVGTSKFGPDPRFGLQAPVLEEMTLTLPSGLIKTITRSRTATLSDPFDVTSLTQLVNTTTADGLVAQNSFDAVTNTYTRTSPLGRKTVTVVDDQLRVTDMNLSINVAPISLEYNAGLVKKISQGIQSNVFTYDEANRMASRTDAADRVVELTRPNGTVNSFDYDYNGNRTTYQMPSGDDHSMDFNEKNLLNSYTPPDNPGLTLSYNLDGQRIQKVLASGREINNTFGSGGLWTAMSYPEADVSFSYIGSTEQVASIKRTPVTNGDEQEITYGYDGSYQTSATFSGVANAEFNYSLDSKLLFITGITMESDDDTISTVVTYDDDGLITGFGSFAFGRGGPGGSLDKISDSNLTLDLTHDSHALVDGRTVRVRSTDYYSLDLTRNSLGYIEQKTETVDGVTHSYDYIYDSVGRLLEVKRDTVQIELYTYDSNGNRLTTLTLTEDATYDNQDRIITHGALAYDFDVDGFMFQRGSDSFDYSTRGELLSAALSSGTAITYHYDGLSRRVGRTDASGTYEYYYGQPLNDLAISAYRSPNGVLTQLYYDGEGLLFAFEREGSYYYVATDNVGTPKLVIDANGTIVMQREYDSFGQLLSDSNPGIDLQIGFAGGLEDNATGLVRFGFRDYDPEAGRWTAMDPILFNGDQMNLYVYTANNPVSSRDSSGLFTFGASAYLGLGGGFEVSYKDGGFAMCGEAGAGMGSGVGISNGDLPKGGTTAVNQVSYGCGPIGASLTVETDFSTDCDGRRSFERQMDELTAEVHFGAIQADNKNGVQFGSVDNSLIPEKIECGMGAKIVGKHCTRF